MMRLQRLAESTPLQHYRVMGLVVEAGCQRPCYVPVMAAKLPEN
jgi:hypothetical protein